MELINLARGGKWDVCSTATTSNFCKPAISSLWYVKNAWLSSALNIWLCDRMPSLLLHALNAKGLSISFSDGTVLYVNKLIKLSVSRETKFAEVVVVEEDSASRVVYTSGWIPNDTLSCWNGRLHWVGIRFRFILAFDILLLDDEVSLLI